MICVILLVFFAPQLARFLLGSTQYTHLLRIIFIGDFFLVFATVPMTRLRIDERSDLFAIIAGANFVIGIALNVLFLLILQMGLYGAVLAMTLNAAVFAFIYTAVIWKDFVPRFSLAELKEMLSFGIPLVPASIFVLVLNMADRYLIRYYMGLDHVAVYSAAARLSMIIALFVNAFQMAWPAVLFSIAKQKEGPQIFARLFNYFNVFLLLCSFILALFAHEFLTLIATAQYAEAAPLVAPLVLSSIFYGINYFASIGVQVEKKTLYYQLFVGLAALVNLLICIFTIPQWGLWGAGIGKVASFAFLGISISLVSLKYYHIPFQFKKIALIYIVAVCAYIIGVSLNIGIWSIPFRVVLVVLFVVVFFILDIVEIAHVKRLTKAILPKFYRTRA
jgi:O-antigen/teichoic acid export membrane protein